MTRTFDLVLVGATGYTGGLAAEHLAAHAPPGLRWAIAGRDPGKLQLLAARLASTGSQPACQIVDAADAAALAHLARSTRVVLSTVGPYVLRGEPLVCACAEAGTHYADITGEAEFVDRMWLKFHRVAQRSGARLVHCCGFEAIAPDLGTLFTVRQLATVAPIRLEAFVRVDARFSSGTAYHSVITAMSRLRERREARRARAAAVAHDGQRRTRSLPQHVRFDRRVRAWVLPFPGVDAQIVRQSATTLSEYGPDFRYGHWLQVKGIGAAIGLACLGAVLLAGSQFKLTREWLKSFRKPGEGPTAEERARGSFTVTFLAESAGKQIRTEVSGGDPGYGETAKMLAEAGLCLACDELPARAGSLTPAVAMGDALIRRLQDAGIQFRVVGSG